MTFSWSVDLTVQHIQTQRPEQRSAAAVANLKRHPMPLELTFRVVLQSRQRKLDVIQAFKHTAKKA